MLPNVGWGEFFIVAVVALIVLGPERLPEAMRWVANGIRSVREFASSAQKQLEDDFGSDFEEFRKPLQEINQLRSMSPRSLVTKHLLDGDESLFTGNFDAQGSPQGQASGTDSAAQASVAAATNGPQRQDSAPPHVGAQGTQPGQVAPPVQGATGELPNYDEAT